jgi:hypothetical protein
VVLVGACSPICVAKRLFAGLVLKVAAKSADMQSMSPRWVCRDGERPRSAVFLPGMGLIRASTPGLVAVM